MSHQHGPDCNHGPSGGGVQSIQINDANKAPINFKYTANYLRDAKKSGLNSRQGVFNGKRFEYFKGKRAIEALLKENYAKVLSKDEKIPTTPEAASALMNEMGKHGFVLHVKPGEHVSGKGSARLLRPHEEQKFEENGYYMWIWEGSRARAYVGAALLVATILAAVLFPLWPEFLRTGVWYLSVGVLCLVGAFFGIAIIRLILYIITLPILPRGFWLFPNLFEDVGVVESFIPLYGFDPVKENKKKSESSSATTTVKKPTTIVEESKEE